jgi:2,3-bisphosphoglycerate-independent phosphoglycerate mutase
VWRRQAFQHPHRDMGGMQRALLMVLVDGIGIAPPGASDPLRRACAFFRGLRPDGPVPLPAGGWAAPARADMGLPGLPQSATGHTAILTGINAAQLLGRHLPGFPTVTLKAMIRGGNLFRRLAQCGRRALYVNAYRPVHPLAVKRGLRSAAAMAAEDNGQRLLGVRDILEGRALHHDFTNTVLIRHGERLPRYTPRHAGRLLGRMAGALDLGFFEYFLTDLAGHAQDTDEARKQVSRIGEFLEGVLEETDLRHTNILVCSDHGNLEDLSVRTHTRNPVPLLVWGPGAEEVASRTAGIEGIANEVTRLLGCQAPAGPVSEDASPPSGPNPHGKAPP